jgi:hypothetical protein
MKRANKLFFKYFELTFWIAALLSLAFSNPAGPAHYSLCPFKALGIWCPGCGLGHSISWLFHGDLTNSWHAHWLGIPALLLILYRIYVLSVQRFSHNKNLFAVKQ